MGLDDTTDDSKDDIKAALDVLRESLMSESPETRRKAAMDILQLHGVTQRDKPKPQVTEAQLEFLGRVLMEVEKISPDLGDLERGPDRVSEISGTA